MPTLVLDPRSQVLVYGVVTNDEGAVVRNDVPIRVTLTDLASAVAGAMSLADLSDVTITSPTNGQVLKYDSADSVWENAADATGA